MKHIVLDRDGVLFDTCEANMSSYLRASSELGLASNLQELDAAIRAGDSIVDFHHRVWPNMQPNQLFELQKAKARIFKESLDLIRIDSYWSLRVSEAADNFYIATKASLDSTIFLLENFLPQFLSKNLYSVQGGSFGSKVEIMSYISQDKIHDEVVLIDDSIVTVTKVIEAGFRSILSSHFCEIHQETT